MTRVRWCGLPGSTGSRRRCLSGEAQREKFARAVAEERLEFIAEITTAGSYVPDRSADA